MPLPLLQYVPPSGCHPGLPSRLGPGTRLCCPHPNPTPPPSRLQHLSPWPGEKGSSQLPPKPFDLSPFTPRTWLPWGPNHRERGTSPRDSFLQEGVCSLLTFLICKAKDKRPCGSLLCQGKQRSKLQLERCRARANSWAAPRGTRPGTRPCHTSASRPRRRGGPAPGRDGGPAGSTRAPWLHPDCASGRPGRHQAWVPPLPPPPPPPQEMLSSLGIKHKRVREHSALEDLAGGPQGGGDGAAHKANLAAVLGCGGHGPADTQARQPCGARGSSPCFPASLRTAWPMGTKHGLAC